MTILINKGTKLLIQGITGREGRLHTKLMLNNGSKIIAGVTPGREGKTIEDKPVYNSIKTAIRKTFRDKCFNPFCTSSSCCRSCL